MVANTSTETFIDPVAEILKEYPYTIMLYNDQVNTFDHVIGCLVEYCEHTPIQAHQCALIVHHKGKCDVKHGYEHVLEPICTALLDNGLKAKIEQK